MPPKAQAKWVPKKKSPEQLKKEAERSELRKAYDIKVNDYRGWLKGQEDKARWLLASRWQQWCEENRCDKTARIVNLDSNRKQQHNMWFHTGGKSASVFKIHQVTLSLLRKDTNMNDMVATLNTHPLAVGSDGKPIAYLFLDGKLDSSTADDHESTYNLKFCSVLGFSLTFGYSRFEDAGNTTHAWLAFGEDCTSRWQYQLGTDLLLNLVGYKCMYDSHMRATEPLDGEVTPFGEWSPPNSPRPVEGQEGPRVVPPRSTAASSSVAASSQPLATGEASSSVAASSVQPAPPIVRRTSQPLGGCPHPPQLVPPRSTAESSSVAASSQPLATGEANRCVAAGSQAPSDQPLAPPMGPPIRATTSQPLAEAAGLPMRPPIRATTSQPLAEAAGLPMGPPTRAATSQPLSQAPIRAETSQPLAGPLIRAETSQPLAGPPIRATTSQQVAEAASGLSRMSLSLSMSRMSIGEQQVSFQPLAEAASRSVFSNEEQDHVGLEYRPVLGEQDPEEEQENSAKMKQAEEDRDWNLLAEMQFKSRVAAVTRVTPKHQRMWLTPEPRFRKPKSAVGDHTSAVGDSMPGVGGTVSMDMDLHAWVVPLGIPFDLERLSAKYAPPSHAVNEAGKFFVGMAASMSITSRKRLEEHPLALQGTAVGVGGWKLGDELPDTDELTGEPVSDWEFHQRWNKSAGLLMHHLIKKHEGELKELEGHWVESSDPFSSIPDALFAPQFSLNDPDFETAMWLDKPRRGSSSKYAESYLWMAKGKGKSKGKPAVGGKGEPSVGGGKGKPAVGGKGQWIAANNNNGVWVSSTLQMSRTGWKYREGSCIDLATVFLNLGQYYTATQLYKYWNTLPPFASKKPHPWGSPWIQQAAHERFQKTGYYGHRDKR